MRLFAHSLNLNFTTQVRLRQSRSISGSIKLQIKIRSGSHITSQPFTSSPILHTAAPPSPSTLTMESNAEVKMNTRIITVPHNEPFGYFQTTTGLSRLNRWDVNPTATTPLQEAASNLRTKSIPVAFPTETVYGLGADATRSDSVKGIYAAKNRPSDNPLIVHVCDLDMLRNLLAGAPIPTIYEPLIERFWPGPLTILLPCPRPATLASEVTAGLDTFGARMPSSPLALSLIKLAGCPLAAPSANASTKPSPTAAHHVKHDLDGRIEIILDGGPCKVGVESTVVDGLSTPPAVLRPGGVSMDELRVCPGWEGVVKGYKDHSEEGKAAPRAPGMKYKHYSPRAKVVLYEASHGESAGGVQSSDLAAALETTNEGATTSRTIGVIRTQRWDRPVSGAGSTYSSLHQGERKGTDLYAVSEGNLISDSGKVLGKVFDIDLGSDPKGVAQGLFAALRELDQRQADTIFVDGIKVESDIAEAVMNRLRKAASEIRV